MQNWGSKICQNSLVNKILKEFLHFELTMWRKCGEHILKKGFLQLEQSHLVNLVHVWPFWGNAMGLLASLPTWACRWHPGPPLGLLPPVRLTVLSRTLRSRLCGCSTLVHGLPDANYAHGHIQPIFCSFLKRFRSRMMWANWHAVKMGRPFGTGLSLLKKSGGAEVDIAHSENGSILFPSSCPLFVFLSSLFLISLNVFMLDNLFPN